MAKARITAKSGALITVEGTQAEVAAILAALEATSVPGAERASTAVAPKSRADTKPMGPSDLLLALRGEGFFDKPRTLAEIANGLEERGFLYPTTTLSGVVLGLLKRGELHRKKLDGRWIYGR